LCNRPGAAVDSGEGTLGDSDETDAELEVVGLGREFRCASFWRRLKETRCSIAGGGVLGHGRRCGTATSVTGRRSPGQAPRGDSLAGTEDGSPT
jgi:hypothetical protein